jgi:ketosteroid isomerase-like protein
MNRKAGALLMVVLSCSLVTRAFAQGKEIRVHSTTDDITKIGDLVEEFRQDIIRKDGRAPTTLMLNPHVLFHSIDNQASVDDARKLNAQFDGIGPSALDGFVALLSTSKDKLEERFQNVEIRQDGDLGLVTFDYDFVINDKIHHSGLEHWQVRKIDGRWKILSVTWTKYLRSWHSPRKWMAGVQSKMVPSPTTTASPPTRTSWRTPARLESEM